MSWATLITIKRQTNDTDTIITIDTYDWGMYVVKSVGTPNNSKRTYSSRKFKYTEKKYKDFAANIARILSYHKISARLISVDWDTDDDLDLENLPQIVDIPLDLDDDQISDYLSDNYYFCVNSWSDIK